MASTESSSVWCCNCNSYTVAELLPGSVVYTGRPDLAARGFWRCPECRRSVGHNTRTGDPLGCIPTPEISKMRMLIHSIIDPLWQQKILKRRDIYAHLSKILGREYHTADLRTVEECARIRRAAMELAKGANNA